MRNSKKDNSGGPPEAIRMAFAKRVQDLLNERGWVQAELARRMAPHSPNSRIGRDNISKYVRGKVLPLPPHLEAMAKAFGVPANEILPTRGREPTADAFVPFDVRDMGDGQYWLRVNKAVNPDVALKVMALLNGAELRV
jgi:transcriptional regulator with XRE-family HTH domain